MANTNRPIANVNLFPLSAAIWANKTEKGVLYNVTLERSYKDDAGKWQSTSNLNANDMLLVAKLANLVDTKVRELRASDRQSDQADEEAA
jgi:hypothetical protein